VKREGFKKSKCTIHGHNECGICSGNYRSKNSTKQEFRKELEKVLNEIEYENEDIISENGVTVKAGDFVVHMSHESYEELNKEILKELKNKGK